MHLPNNTVVALADGGRHLLLINRGDEDILDLRRLEEETQENPPTHEQGRDRPGAFSSSVRTGGAPEAQDLHERAETRFAHELVQRLAQMKQKGELHRLVIAADPKTLGEVRSALDESLRSSVIAEIPRDLLKLPLPEIERALAKWQSG